MQTFKQFLEESEIDSQLQRGGIKRTKKFDGVGKEIGGSVYCHRIYENQFPSNELKLAKSKLPEDFNYSVVKYDYKNKTFSFIMCNNFDSNPEPDLDGGITVKSDGSSKPFKGSGWIYHHKHLFVADGYAGFDVDESKRRSLSWINLPIDKSRIGQRKYWDTHVVPMIKEIR